MRKLRLLSLYLLAIAFIVASCTKEGPEGPVGAQGAQGPPGTGGAAGATGPAGPAGPSGSSVIYSAWFAFAAADWKDTAISLNTIARRAIRNTATITQAIVDQGIVLAYTNSAGVYPLPWIFANPFAANQTLQLSFFIVPTKVFFTITNLTNGNSTGITYTGQVRYVILPGTIAGGKIASGAAAGYTVDQLKRMPYKQVATMFNIPESGSNIE